jgi:putative nucleotidyltransferase with HDIG domain
VIAPLGELAKIGDAWLVGGAVRDRLLGRESTDYDVALAGDPGQIARSLGRSAGGHAFALSESFGAWRVVAHDRRWQVDLIPLSGGSVEEDLAQRDLTINAIAEPLAGGEHVDPFGGLADLRSGRLRMVSAGAFERDPLRAVRVARLACELGFEVDAPTVEAARSAAPGLRQVAAERIFAELKRLLVSQRPARGLELMESVGATAVVLPELLELRGVEQSHFHHLDAHDHTIDALARTVELERDLGPVFAGAAPAVQRVLQAPLADELTRWQGLRFGALLHDIAKPQTRQMTPTGRVTFMGHDEVGARTVVEILRRLRASERLCDYVAGLTRNHLRLGFLVHETPLSRRAVYRYLKACTPLEVEVTVLSVADRLATGGTGAPVAIARHLELAGELMMQALAWRADPPRPPVRGDELARELGMPHGPELGSLLQTLEEASFTGEISSSRDAFRLARRRRDGGG